MTLKSYTVLLELVDILETENEYPDLTNLKMLLKSRLTPCNIMYVQELDRANPTEIRRLITERDQTRYFLLENINVERFNDNNDHLLVSHVLDSIAAKQKTQQIETNGNYNLLCVE